MKQLTLYLLLIVFSFCANGQSLVFIKGPIISNYLENGHPNKNFINIVDNFENDLYNGNCKIYEITFENSFFSKIDDIEVIQDTFLLYEEGQMVNGIKQGLWKYFLIEDKTLIKYPLKESTYKNGLKEGPFTYFFPSGNVVSKGTYLNGQLDGEISYFNENGILISTSQQKNNLSNGPEITYFTNGQKQYEKNFVNGVIHGEFKKYYPNGKIEEYQEFNMGVFDGLYKYYYENGNIWVEKEFKNGLLWNVVSNFAQNGTAQEKGSLINGNGTLNYYTLEGKLYAILTFLNGEEVNREMK
ncbi:MAG: hypothetical protein RLZ33_194 [Bacteroidota bacterium]|jgi:antitoxin component YwqK of YwqJK toxin-antitoxin module